MQYCGDCYSPATCKHQKRCYRNMPLEKNVWDMSARFYQPSGDMEVTHEPISLEAAARKATPIYSGVVKYFPRALAEVARVSYIGNEQHNPGSPLHWDRAKSQDELDALMRHLTDHAQGLEIDTDECRHLAKVAWRALAMLEKELEKDG